MARLVTEGAELGISIDSHILPRSVTTWTGGGTSSLTVQTTPVRSGARCFRCQSGASNTGNAYVYWVDSTEPNPYPTLFGRVGIRFAGWPAAKRSVGGFFHIGNTGHPHYQEFASNLVQVLVGTTGLIEFWTYNINTTTWTQHGSGYQLSLDTYHVVEIEANVDESGNDSYKLRVDGTERNTGTSTNWEEFSGRLGFWAGFNPNLAKDNGGNNDTMYMDDIALNDDQGASQNTYPGVGKVILLKPISDNTRSAGMVAGAGGTTNLWDAVNNIPPVGVALGSATNTSQIKDAANNATDNYDANVETYTTGGLTGSDVVLVAFAFANLGGSSNGITQAVKAVSNPADSGEATSANSGTAGTFHTGWTVWNTGAIVYSPSVTLGTSPVVRYGKRTATTNSVMCDSLGLMIEYGVGSGGSDHNVSEAPAGADAISALTQGIVETATATEVGALTFSDSDSVAASDSVVSLAKADTDSLANADAAEVDNGTEPDNFTVEEFLPVKTAGITEALSTAEVVNVTKYTAEGMSFLDLRSLLAANTAADLVTLTDNVTGSSAPNVVETWVTSQNALIQAAALVAEIPAISDLFAALGFLVHEVYSGWSESISYVVTASVSELMLLDDSSGDSNLAVLDVAQFAEVMAARSISAEDLGMVEELVASTPQNVSDIIIVVPKSSAPVIVRNMS